MADAVAHLGVLVDEHLADDRTAVDNQRFVVSEPSIAGRTVAELDIPGRFGGVITRVRRGDLDLLARDDLTLELGDRVLAVVPREELAAVSRVPRRLRAAGVRDRRPLRRHRHGARPAPRAASRSRCGGGAAFALGSAAGPLLVGMVLGPARAHGSGRLGLPRAANLTIRQLGLLFFLAAVGLASGQAFAVRGVHRDGCTGGGRRGRRRRAGRA